MDVDVAGLQTVAPVGDQTVVYGVLAATLLSFVLTFGVVPRYKQHFREGESWRDIYSDLQSLGGVESISPQEASRRIQRGAMLMDVRMQRAYVQGTARDGVNCPLYQPISGWSLPANIRRAGFAFFGMYGTERNPRWQSDVEMYVPKGTEIIVACGTGGSMQAKAGADRGFASQSLKAAYFLKRAGYKRVSHMEGGLSEYKRSVGPLEAPEAESQQPQSEGASA